MSEENMTYPTVLHRLIAEMEALDAEQIGAQEPAVKRARNEEVIGPLPASLQSLFSLWQLKVNAFNCLIEQHTAEHEAETEDAPARERLEHQALHGQLEVLQEEVGILATAFWRSVREQFTPDPEADGLAIRADWQVVDTYGRKQEGGVLSGIAEAISKMMGGGVPIGIQRP